MSKEYNEIVATLKAKVDQITREMKEAMSKASSYEELTEIKELTYRRVAVAHKLAEAEIEVSVAEKESKVLDDVMKEFLSILG